MFKSYLQIAIQNILVNKLFSIINILGLALGLSICFLILLFVRHENTFDKYYDDAENIYRVTRHYDNEDLHIALIAPPFKDAIEAEFSQYIESISLMGSGFDMTLGRDDKVVEVTDMLMADSDIFDTFNFEVISGAREGALDRANTLVLSKSLANTLFGSENPIGQYLYLFGQTPFEVTAVLADQPHNTHMQFSLLIAYETMRNWVPDEFKNWDVNYSYLYLRLKAGTDPALLQSKFPALMDSFGENVTEDQSIRLQAVTDIHLHSNLSYEIGTNGSYIIVYSFSLIAIVILLIACINFMNLSTARGTQRAKEVGVRKALGASRSQLSVQFLVESTLITAIAMLIANAIVEISLPYFAHFIERNMSDVNLYSYESLSGILVATLIVGIFAGSYPAFYLTHFKPQQVLKGLAIQGKGTTNIRKVLVVLQFAISITLIVATIVVIKQVDFARNADPGYDRANNITIPLFQTQAYPNRHILYNTFREQLLSHPAITSVAGAQQLLTSPLQDIWSYVREDQNIVAENMVSIPTLNVSYHFHPHYKIKLIAGRYFSEELGDTFVQIPTQDNLVGSGFAIVSRSAANDLGYSPEQAVGKFIKIPFAPGYTNYKIVGVVEDIHFGSVREDSQSQIYHLVKYEERQLSIRYAPDQRDAALFHIDKIFSELMPNRINNRSSLDENFDDMYRQEEKQATVFLFFSGLAITVASMGLFGLAAFTTERRRKEIGIRKVMGASVLNIITLLTREFSILVLIANLFAWPLAYISMEHWLQQFSQRIDLNLGIFIVAGLMPLLLAWLIIALHAAHAAMSTPVHNLRAE
ncbi:ABC transporter permease [Agaribacter flavus]|uniref:ABC transporter permease n=1 Tax=Agaribacter flavus TaxID=1902781 RepID=A0ABV7FWM7_9ALTE